MTALTLNRPHCRTCLPLALAAALVFALGGCKKPASGENAVLDAPPPKTPVEAATRLEQAFGAAPTEVKSEVARVAASIRSGDYEAAVVSLQALRHAGNQTMEQGLAVHNSNVALEQRLIAGIQAGDPKAKRAYDLLKKMKKN